MDANGEQIRGIAESVAKVAVAEYVRENPPPAPPAPAEKSQAAQILKWAAGIVGAVLAGFTLTSVNSAVASISDMKVTLARIDERTSLQSKDYERRIARLEHSPVPEKEDQ